MLTTPNLSLKKPEGTDIVDIADLNSNMDILDAAVTAKETPAGAQTKVDTHANRTDNPHGVTSVQVGAIPTAEKGAANGVASLDAGGKVPSAQLPSSIDAAKIADGSVTNTEFQYINSLTSNAQTQLNAKAPLASPALTGTPTAPTAASGTATTQIATTAYAKAQDQRAVTLVVAAVDSTAKGKAVADYVCDGVSDNATINSALNVIPAGGGKVILLEGTYTLSGNIYLASNKSLEGQGDGTVLRVANGTSGIIMIQSYQTAAENTALSISNLKLDGNRANQTSGSHLGIGFYITTYSRIEDVTIVGMLNNGIYVGNNSKYNIIRGNKVSACGQDGFALSDSHLNLIANNIVQSSGANGLVFGGSSSDNTMHGNLVLESGQSAHNTYDNIVVWGHYNNIQGNTCRQGALANKPRYGIKVITSAATGNFVTNNDLTSGGVSGGFSDSGTGTVSTAGNKLA